MNPIKFCCLLHKLIIMSKYNINLRKIIIRCNHHIDESILFYGEDVISAKKKHLPIVALESTIITHGMPYPDNLITTLEVENIIKKKGVIPATIAVLDGKIKVGANKEEIERLSKNNDQDIIKISRRDFSYAMSQGLSGGTTVSGTMLIAKQAGIPIMATGGIGGVHRQVEFSMDISADLKELGQTSVAVVCSGIKSILDIPKTLEYLESQGVPVVTVGSTTNFPAFYSQQTLDCIQSPMRVCSPLEASRLIILQKKLVLNTGIVLAVPVPKSDSFDPQEIEAAIKQALEASKLNNITGNNITPYLQTELTRITGGRSLQSNKALIKNNAEVAAEIAIHLNEFQNKIKMSTDNFSNTLKLKKNPVVIGGATFDTILRVKEREIKLNGSTHKGKSYQSCGGVGRNLTAALINLGMTDTKLLSIIGTDEAGKKVIQSIGSAASTVHALTDISTAKYTAVIDIHGNCCFGIGEMEAFTKINKSFLQENVDILKNSSLLVMDGNLSLDAMKFVLDISIQNQIPVWYEPTDTQKVLKIFQCGSQWQNVLSFISPNVNELMVIAKHLQISVPAKQSDIDFKTIKTISEFLVKWIPVVITTLGAKGVLVARKSPENELLLNKKNSLIQSNEIRSRLYPALDFDEKIVSTSGCGDCLAAGIITGILKGWNEFNCICLGLHAAKQSLTSHENVPNSLKSLPVIKNYYSSYI